MLLPAGTGSSDSMSDGRTTPLAGNYTGSMTSSEAGTTTRSAGVDTLISPTSVSRLLLLQLRCSRYYATLVSLNSQPRSCPVAAGAI